MTDYNLWTFWAYRDFQANNSIYMVNIYTRPMENTSLMIELKPTALKITDVEL